ncbi:MAG: hypothetical protein LC750_00450 [Actinobacteria bacterium]|nr:hypothetical protein [Actinomycetota bacterium]
MTERLWLVFFMEPDGPAWWARLLRPGFRHVAAASWYAAEERWVYFNPSRAGTSIQIFTAEQFPPVLTALLDQSTAVLRVASRFERGNAPALAFCVGEVKALLGLCSPALTPFGLYRDLRALGAEVVREKPCVVPEQGAAAPSAP